MRRCVPPSILLSPWFSPILPLDRDSGPRALISCCPVLSHWLLTPRRRASAFSVRLPATIPSPTRTSSTRSLSAPTLARTPLPAFLFALFFLFNPRDPSCRSRPLACPSPLRASYRRRDAPSSSAPTGRSTSPVTVSPSMTCALCLPPRRLSPCIHPVGILGGGMGLRAGHIGRIENWPRSAPSVVGDRVQF